MRATALPETVYSDAVTMCRRNDDGPLICRRSKLFGYYLMMTNINIGCI